MEAVLYAEIYAVCIIAVGVLLFWTRRHETLSTEELWLKRTLTVFLLNFTANFCFTLVNRLFVWEGAPRPLSWLFKSLYFLTLNGGVFVWCGYAATVSRNRQSRARPPRYLWWILSALSSVLILVNLKTHWLFEIDADLVYRRHFLFQGELALFVLLTTAFSIPLLKHARAEAEPVQRSHLILTASFPICMLVSLALSFAGETFPVICVCVTLELLCLYIGALNHQVSIDSLTQVNNRQNLFGYMNYKLKNHEEPLHFLMIDLDGFKRINDTWGHPEGDNALVTLAGVLKKACGPFRKRPYIARYGGDEFIVVMEGSADDAAALCELIRKTMDEANRSIEAYDISLSIGEAEWREGMTPKEVISEADRELYRIKSRKRDKR